MSPYGSSPLARGLPAWGGEHLDDPGIIPARAGFTQAAGRNAVRRQDHPRSRGVYPLWRKLYSAPLGSSPLARGLLAALAFVVAALRIIPARAGFTSSVSSTYFSLPDHPRSRGVYLLTGRERVSVYGSSPLARGLPGRRDRPGGAHRIIPARAGFTMNTTDPYSQAADHPRSRGVYRGRSSTTRRGMGSSPLARGLRRRLAVHDHPPGIIPARAGFTHLEGR